MQFVDTNVFIYALTAHPRFVEKAKRILQRIEGGEAAVTSTLVLRQVEARVKSKRWVHVS